MLYIYILYVYTMWVHGTGTPLESLFKPPVLGPHGPTGHVLSHYLPVVQPEKIGMEAVQTAWLLQLALLTARRRKHNWTSIAMSSVAAGMERDAAEGAAVAHVPGMDDRITFSFFFVSVLGQEKKRRRVRKSESKLSTQDLSWLLAFKMARQEQQLPQNYMYH